ncbi:transglycosylase domain-containing protein [Piscinibacter terrae]|uniref:Biosynthetic peptidoglycan transglycosylase n=1 Tax=Piscinibacter terrae TaxID=2496871 RepID=A0A3N7JWK7_9BURK|nr:transglycosylase domain-containing protein [Albitalea terrae]RQP23255.1 monofunctional biosynthetic peptidoglycan transglycosylase [Albitalea terrae]
MLKQLWRIAVLVVLSFVALQLYFLARVALMIVVDPQSTTFQRSEVVRLMTEKHQILWSQHWVDNAQISGNLKRAVIASEDANFFDHSGVEWDALEKAWEKNQAAEARVAKINAENEKRAAQLAAREAAREAARAGKKKAASVPATPPPSPKPPKPVPHVQAKIVGGSTITQQLAKNLFLGSERNIARKGQEFLITFMLEALLDKQRILEIYLNNVEWGEGVFGADAASRHYFHVAAAQLGPSQAARLAVMLPAPKRFEKKPDSAYVVGRAGTVMARMGAVELP